MCYTARQCCFPLLTLGSFGSPTVLFPPAHSPLSQQSVFSHGVCPGAGRKYLLEPGGLEVTGLLSGDLPQWIWVSFSPHSDVYKEIICSELIFPGPTLYILWKFAIHVFIEAVGSCIQRMFNYCVFMSITYPSGEALETRNRQDLCSQRTCCLTAQEETGIFARFIWKL